MLDTMERIRMIFDTEERYRRAIKLYAARHGKTASDVIHEAVDALCAKELIEADELLENAPPEKPKPKRRDA